MRWPKFLILGKFRTTAGFGRGFEIDRTSIQYTDQHRFCWLLSHASTIVRIPVLLLPEYN